MPKLEEFSKPEDPAKYSCVPISSDMITDVYLEFIENTRKQESTDFCKTRTGQIIMFLVPIS
jgi:hypothetical protein